MVRGDGSVYQRGDGRWVGAHVTTAGKRRYVYGKTKSEATRKLRELQAKDRTGTLAEPSRLTVGAWLDEWLSARASIRANTRRSYKGVIDNHLVPHLGSVKLQALTSRHLVRLYADMAKAGAGERTLELAHTVLCASLKAARAHRLIVASPCDLVEKPRVERREMDTYAPDEVAALLGACETTFERAAMRCLLGAGLRWGELSGLKWRDVDLERGTLSIQRQLVEEQDDEGRVRLNEAPPKSERGRRRIPIGASLVEDLRDLRRAQLEGVASEYVFAGGRGKPWRNTNFTRRVFRPLCERAGVRVLRIHDLRHTCATLLMAGGMHPKVVAERLGNDELVTLKTYSHVTPDMQRAAAELLEGVLAGGAS